MRKIPFTRSWAFTLEETQNIAACFEDGSQLIEQQIASIQALMHINDVLAKALDSVECSCYGDDELCSRCSAVQRARAAVGEFA